MALLDELSLERVKRALPALQDELAAYQNVALTRAGDQIRDRPVLAVLLAFGLGIIGDFLLRRSLTQPARPPRRRARTRRVAH